MPSPSELISPEYCDAQRWMHAQPKGYGGRGDHWAGTVIALAKRYQVQTILDYGAGQGSLGRALREAGLECHDYDPAVEGWDAPPEPADLVVSSDVLEHIEPDKLDAVLAHLRSLTKQVAFFVVATRPANKRLPNGDNAHLIIKNKVWWRARVEAAGFTVRKAPAPHTLPEKMPGKCWMAVLKP